MPDIEIQNEGTIFLFTPLNEEARKILEEHTDGQWYAGSLVVEHRYAEGLASALIADFGLELE